MKCSEFHDLAAGYALDALDEDERAACERHLRAEGPHEGCEALVARYGRAVAGLSSSVSSVSVPPNLWRAIEQRLGIDAPATRPRSLHAYLAWAVAAVALLAALWSRQGAQHAERLRLDAERGLANTAQQLTQAEAAQKECSTLLERVTERGALAHEAFSLLERSSTRVTPMAATVPRPVGATTIYDPASQRAFAISSTVEPIPDKDYALWVIASRDGTPRPAGFLTFDDSGYAIGEFDASLLEGGPPAAFAVSIEPAGGRPTPTEVILVAKLGG